MDYWHLTPALIGAVAMGFAAAGYGYSQTKKKIYGSCTNPNCRLLADCGSCCVRGEKDPVYPKSCTYCGCSLGLHQPPEGISPKVGISPEVMWPQKPIIVLDRPIDWAKAKLGDVLEVSMLHSGLVSEPELKIFVRQACLDLFNFLGTRKEQILMVEGCPGVGKSVEVFSYVMSQAQKDNKRVLYIHGEKSRGFFLLRTGPHPADNKAMHIRKWTKETPELLTLITDTLDAKETDVVVLDGALGWLINEVYYSSNDYRETRFIMCTSFQAMGKISSEDYCFVHPAAQFTMDSWTKKEYADAIDAGAIQLPAGRSLDEMFYYVGGSVRYLRINLDELIVFLKQKVDSVPDIVRVLDSGVGESSVAAVNSLKAIYGGDSVLLSKFVAVSLWARVSDDFISRARDRQSDNSVWQGWVTEMEVLSKVRGIGAIRLQNHRPANRGSSSVRSLPLIEVWESSRKPHAFLDSSDVCFWDERTGWFLSVRWHQACFDALYRLPEHKLRVVQITDAESHSCELQHVIPFVKAMSIHKVEFVFICRKHNFDDFQIPTPSTTALLRVLEANAAGAAEAASGAVTKKQRVGDESVAVGSSTKQRAGGGGEERSTRSKKEHIQDTIIFRKVCYEIDDQVAALYNRK